MSVACYPGNLNPEAPDFIPANLNPIPFFVPTGIYLPLPPPLHCPRFFPDFPGALPPSPPHLPPISSTPTRAMVLLPVPPDVSESSIRRDLEVFGEVRGVQMERADEGIVTVHFYNLRHSQRALREIRERHMHQEQVRFGRGYTAARGLVSGRTVWAHFVFPQVRAVPEGNNQGSLVIMNLEPTVSSITLRHIFEVYGKVKELRETPFKKEQRFVEFYDVRDAALARREMDGKSIDGKQIIIQFSRPGGFHRKLFLASRLNKSFLFNHQHQQPLPPFPPHYCPQLPSPGSRFRKREPVKGKPALGDNQRYEQHHKNNNNLERSKKQTKKDLISDGCFIINEDGIAAAESSGCSDGRTTVMIKNIPNKYTQELFMNMLDTHCKDCNENIIREGNNTPMSSYDFIYLPIDFGNKCNVGYGFVNMTTLEAVWRLYKAFHHKHWGVFMSKKICEVTYARVQGVESLKEHFKNSRLPGVEMEKYMPPVIFSPPRDGWLLTEPISIVDLGTKPVEDSCHARDETVTSCLSSDKTIERSDGCHGDRIENGGVSDDESKTVVH